MSMKISEAMSIIEEIYAKFRKFCRLFKREFERQRGNLTKPAEA